MGCQACTKPDDAETTVGFEESVIVPDVMVVADAVTVGVLDRLNTVERVTGIVPPDDATMTSGVELSVNVPDEMAMADERVIVPEVIVVAVLTTVQLELGDTIPLLRLVGLLKTTVGLLDRVTVPLDRDRTRNPEDAVSTVGVPLICTSPLEADRTVTVFTTFTAVVAAFVNVTAVLGLLMATNTPPEVVTGP